MATYIALVVGGAALVAGGRAAARYGAQRAARMAATAAESTAAGAAGGAAGAGAGAGTAAGGATAGSAAGSGWANAGSGGGGGGAKATFTAPGLNATGLGSGMFGKRFYDGGFEEKMSKREAALILGCRESSTKEKIMDRYRTLMKLNHPDLGGSPFLSTKINEAKDLLGKTARVEPGAGAKK